MALRLKEFIRTEFVRRMRGEVVANHYKGDWNKWKPSKVEMVMTLEEHYDKLREAIANGSSHEVSEFAADIANLAMKADEIHGAEDYTPERMALEQYQ